MQRGKGKNMCVQDCVFAQEKGVVASLNGVLACKEEKKERESGAYVGLVWFMVVVVKLEKGSCVEAAAAAAASTMTVSVTAPQVKTLYTEIGEDNGWLFSTRLRIAICRLCIAIQCHSLVKNVLHPTYNPTATTFISNTNSTPHGPALTYPSYVGTNKPIFFSSPNFTPSPRAPFHHASTFTHRNAFTQFQCFSCHLLKRVA
ncbi:hypothetical protein VNO80_08857 [Phaseolus coccineus]|uniref:Uncharacterized protein n=1 Tax=Phaseolus coccineus TaxID=3886 RepID=A0AAN9N5S3_PHACN